MDKEATIIRTTDGCYWLDTTDDAGRRRSSYLGNIGSAVAVEAWCQGRAIEFRQVGRPSASAARTRGRT
jgi:hypothetical protein